MYRLNLYENSVYPFVRFGDCTRNISAPILNILAAILMATSSPVIIAGTKEFDASWLDIAMKGLPKFDHYRSTYLALDMGPLPAASARFVHQTIKGVPDPGQDSNGIGCINVLANAGLISLFDPRLLPTKSLNCSRPSASHLGGLPLAMAWATAVKLSSPLVLAVVSDTKGPEGFLFVSLLILSLLMM